MAKWIKKILGAAAVGTAAAGALYYWKKTKVDTDEFEDDFEDDDFDLDDDLKPAADREYVSLNPASKNGEETPAEDASEEKTEETPAEEEKTEEAPAEDASDEEKAE